MNLKQFVRNILPNAIIDRYISYKTKQKISEFLKCDTDKILKSQLSCTLEKQMAQIIMCYHVIEKGITMPNRKLGFGKDVLMQLINVLDNYIDKVGLDNEHAAVAIGVVAEYKGIHDEMNFKLEKDVHQTITVFLQKYNNLKPTKQIKITKTEFFKNVNSSFDLFSKSRYSVRDFKGEIALEVLEQSIELAQNAPSACNRQSTRVKIITDKKMIEKIFSIQRGNRGFGHMADKLIILTTEMGCWDIVSRNGGYVDGGIYLMNLLYALHFYNVAACTLNSCFQIDEERLIRKIINISETENFVAIIAIGDVPDKFMLANSHRWSGNTITTIK